jgi:3'(2'), 5'-bisphosphate nucleotidase
MAVVWSHYDAVVICSFSLSGKNEMIKIDNIVNIAIAAGKEILTIYHSNNFEVEMKSDDSPLTKADCAAHNIIVGALKKYTPEIPILSEEGKDIPYSERKHWQKFWLVDPLDGTKEFIKKNGEFTVNIALIEYGYPVLGVIYAPALTDKDKLIVKRNKSSTEDKTYNFDSGVLYFAEKSIGSFKQISGDYTSKIEVNNSTKNGVVAVKSRSHSSEEEEKVLIGYGVVNSISTGSSLKFCMVAEGKAQIYYRHGHTNEWDVGAGYAIAKFAGAEIDGLSFNKEVLLNGSFLVKSIN